MQFFRSGISISSSWIRFSYPFQIPPLNIWVNFVSESGQWRHRPDSDIVLQAWMTYYWIGHSDDFATTQSNDGEGAAIA